MSIKNIVVFCSGENGEDYQDFAYNVGKVLAQNKFTVITGGGPGLMQSVNQGAFENGAKSIGIRITKSPRKTKKYLTDLEIYDTFDKRHSRLLSLGDAFIALPGGLGTILEALEITQRKRLEEIDKNTPLIFVNGFFKDLVDSLNKIGQNGYIKNYKELLCFAENEKELIKILKKYDSKN